MNLFILLVSASAAISATETPHLYPETPAFVAAMDRVKARGIVLADPHIHIRGGMIPDKARERQVRSDILSGVLENHGREWPLSDNAKLNAFIDECRRAGGDGASLPVGIQVNDRDWHETIDPATRARLDYVLADTMIMGTDEQGKPRRLWLPGVTIDDPEAWMETYVSHTLRVLDEPIDILANPTYLPACLADRYDELWTDDRMRRVIDLAVQNGVALEIQAESKFPGLRFLEMARRRGAKFAFGTNNFSDKVKSLDRWFDLIERLDLTPEHVWTPPAPAMAAEAVGRVLPRWFEEQRVQAHFENGFADDHAGLFQELHPAIRSMGAGTLTRIFKTVGEGAWWPTAAGATHEGLDGRDLGREMAAHAHEHGLKVIAYYRIMCDDVVETEHPDWLCLDETGARVVEPRTRKRPEPDRRHVICFNSPAKEWIRTRLIELADRGVDGIYFDSWHMPEVCVCEHCRTAFRGETGREMDVAALSRGSAEYRCVSDFVARTIRRNFLDWERAAKARRPDLIFAIGSSLYPCFDTQMQLTADLLAVSDTSKTEFSKPFGGSFGDPAAIQIKSLARRRPYWEASFAIPPHDVQNALGWSFTRDSSDGRPPLMWVPHTLTGDEALISVAASVAYGCVASVHPMGLISRRTRTLDAAATDMYKPCYDFGRRVSPHLAGARPNPFALIHISERSRNDRIADPRAMWIEFFAPILGAFEAMKEQHLPVATVNDRQLARPLPDGTRLVILPNAGEISAEHRTVLDAFEAGGGVVIRLRAGSDWHLKDAKPGLKSGFAREVLDAIGRPPIRAQGPASMHAVFFRDAATGRQVVNLVNDFGWFKTDASSSQRIALQDGPSPCAGVAVEWVAAGADDWRAVDAVTGRELNVRRDGDVFKVDVPEFPLAACIVLAPALTPAR